MQSGSSPGLTFTAFLSLLLALLLSLPLVERTYAAIWQWYKFAGYLNDGHITLSFGTGLLFSGFLAAIFILALTVNYFARHQAAVAAKRLSLLAMIWLVVVASGYWLLGISSLNAWRA